MSAGWDALIDRTVVSQRGKPMWEYEDRLYVLNKERDGLEGKTEYYCCANIGGLCNARVIRVTPPNGAPPFVKLGRAGTQVHHHLCVADPQAIVVKKARQEIKQVVAAQSSTVGIGIRSIRAAYDVVGSSVLQNAG